MSQVISPKRFHLSIFRGKFFADILSVMCLMVLMLSCGESRFVGSNATKSPAQDTQAKPVAAGNVAQNAAPTGIGNGNMSADAQGSSGPANGNVNGNVSGSGPGNGSLWQPNQVITDLITLEFCKLEAAKITGNSTIILTCFAKYVEQGGKITAKDCGCVQQTTTTVSADGKAATS